jgi:DNA (cytosine-5)-methyltransferase 1
MARPPLTFYEFFAGGGMARTGLGEGWTCAFANDFDAVKAKTYRANFADAEPHFRQGDVWDLSAADLPGRADLAWASSPCQDFSLAGGRAGLAGGRSSAFFGFWRLMQGLVEEGRAPRIIVLENVTGLLTSNGGADFAALGQALADAGYVFGALEIDAAHFVPQSRPRVFVVAWRGEPPAGLTGDSPFHTRAVRQAHARLPAQAASAWVWWRLAAAPRRNTDLAALLEDDRTVTWDAADRAAAWLEQMSPLHRTRLEGLRAKGGRVVGAVFRRMRKGAPRAEVRFDGLAGCLRTPRGGSSRQTILVADETGVRTRLLSAREAARLMGLPETYVLPRALTSALHVAGDGVAAPVVRWLAAGLLEPLLARPAILAAE